MPVPTYDPDVVIETQDETGVVYHNVKDGRRWKVSGKCDQCGLCMVGAVDRPIRWAKPVGEPGACIDLEYGKRLDIPIIPDSRCHLKLEWILCRE